MDKTLLSDLKRKMFIRSALIGLDSLGDILSINDYLSGDEILLEIIKKALKEFELSNPLILEMPINRGQMCTCAGMDGYCEIKSNFSLYLKCMLPEGRIILVPNSIPQWRIGSAGGGYINYAGYGGTSSYPQPLAYTYFTDYQKPYVFMADVPQTDLIIRGICSRPIIPDFLPDKSFNINSDKAAVYWLDVENGARGNYFMDLCMTHLLDYLRQLKASLILPNTAVDVLANVDSSYQELRSRCDQYNLQSGWYGELLM
jgi:hypothetical protein